MPCNGIAVTTAQLNIDLAEFFKDTKNREAFVKWLESQGIKVARTHGGCCWWNRPNGIALSIGSLWTGLAFVGNEMQISDEGEEHVGGGYKTNKAQVDNAYGLAQLYIGQQIQAQIIQGLTAMQLSPRDMTALPNGAIEVRVNISAAPAMAMSVLKETALLKIGTDGSMTAVSENGGFDEGKTKLELLLGMLGNQSGLDLAASGEFETHRHAEQQQHIAQYT